MMRIFTVLSLLSLTLIACERESSVNVNQDTIHTEYRLVYDAADDITYARASFRFGGATGTLLELSDGAEVSIDGDVLAFKQLLAYYEREYAGVLSDGTFSYTDLDGNTFENEVIASKAIDFPADLDTISKGGAYTLTWEGDPISAGESVIVTLNGQLEADARIFTTTNIGATDIILDQDKLNEVATGNVRIIMERFTPQLLQDGTSEGGTMWSRYITELKVIQVVE